jgi:electron transport complex protein RnfA
MDVGRLISVAAAAVLVNNIVLARLLGVCPVVGGSRQLRSALGLGFVVACVMTAASAATFAVYSVLLVPLGIEVAETLAFMLVIVALVRVAEVIVGRASPSLSQVFGGGLPLVTANCAVLGVALINVEKSYDLLTATVHGAAAGLGFTLVLVLVTGLRERLELGPVPESLKGAPIILVLTGLVALAFLGFSGLVIE